jgi:hypothetical protein
LTIADAVCESPTLLCLLCCSLATLLYFARSWFAVVVERELRCSAEQRRPTRKLNEVQAGDFERVFSCAPAILTPQSAQNRARRTSSTARADWQRELQRRPTHKLRGAFRCKRKSMSFLARRLFSPGCGGRAEPCASAARVNGESRLAGRQAGRQAGSKAY